MSRAAQQAVGTGGLEALGGADEMSDWRSGWIGVDVRGIAKNDMHATFEALKRWIREADFPVQDLDGRALGEFNGTSVEWSRYENVGPWVDEAQRLLEDTLQGLGHALVDDFRRVKRGETVYARAAFADSSPFIEGGHEDFSRAVRFIVPEAPMSTDIAWVKLRSARTLDHKDLEIAVRLGEVHPETLRQRLGSTPRDGLLQPEDISARLDALVPLIPAPKAPSPFDTAETTFASLASGLTPDVDLEAQRAQLFQLTFLAVQSPTPDSRRAVMRVVPHLDARSQLLIIRNASRSSDPWLRRWAVDAAVANGAEGIDLVRDLAGDAEPGVAVAFLDLLLAIHDPHSMHAAVRLLKHRSPAVRARAGLLVGLVGSRGFASDLRRASDVDDDARVKEALGLAGC